MVLYCNELIVLFTKIACKKQTNTENKEYIFNLQYPEKYNSWHTGAGVE